MEFVDVGTADAAPLRVTPSPRDGARGKRGNSNWVRERLAVTGNAEELRIALANPDTAIVMPR